MDRNKKVILNIGAILILAVSSLSGGSSLSNSLVDASTSFGFSLRGASVQADCFVSSAQSWYPNAWQQLKEGGVNWIRVSGGREGDINHFNIINYPNEWAQNLDNFLAQASLHDIKVSFASLGTTYGTLFGIVSPGVSDQSDPNASYTSISQAETMIDQLSGNNKLHHNFITDPRVLGWVTSNEAYIGSITNQNPNYNGPFILNWNLQLLDYIHSKGGKAWISSPSVSLDSSEGYDFAKTLPLIANHVDFLEAHYYEESALVSQFSNGDGTYNWKGFEKYYENLLLEKMVNVRGNFLIDHVLLGEFGMWIGSGDDVGVKQNFTDQDRTNYYTAVIKAAENANLRSICQYNFFEEANTTSTNYAVVSLTNKSYFPNDAGNVLTAAYGATIISIQVAPSASTVGSLVTITGNIFPIQEGVSISILVRVVGEEWNNLSTVISNSTGFFSYVLKCTIPGLYDIKSLSQRNEVGPQTESNTANVVVAGSVVVNSIWIGAFPTEVNASGTINIKGAITPASGGSPITISYKSLSDIWRTLAVVTSDSFSQFSYSWSNLYPGSYQVKAECKDSAITTKAESNVVIVKVNKENSSLTLCADNCKVTVDSNLSVSGMIHPFRSGILITLLEKPVSKETNKWNELTSVKTNLSSGFSFNWSSPTVGSYELKASWQGDGEGFGSESNILKVNVISTSIPEWNHSTIPIILIVLVIMAVVVMGSAKVSKGRIGFLGTYSS